MTLSSRRLISTWLPVALMVMGVASESTPSFGGDHTGHLLRPVWEFFFGVTSDVRWEFVHHLIRKSGHFLYYGALGLVWLRAWLRTWKVRFVWDRGWLLWRWSMQMSMCCTCLVAAMDETHQSYLPNRTGLVTDVLLDSSGAVLMVGAAFVVMWARVPRGSQQTFMAGL